MLRQNTADINVNKVATVNAKGLAILKVLANYGKPMNPVNIAELTGGAEGLVNAANTLVSLKFILPVEIGRKRSRCRDNAFALTLAGLNYLRGKE